MLWPTDPIAWFNLAAGAATFAGLALTLWTLVLVRRMKDQRARLVLLPDLFRRIETGVLALQEAPGPEAMWEILQHIDASLESPASLLPRGERALVMRERAALNGFVRLPNPFALPPLGDLLGPAFHMLAVLNDVVERIQLQEP